MPDVIEVVEGPTPVIDVIATPVTVLEVIETGPRGPTGDPGAGAIAVEVPVPTPAATWVIPIPGTFTRRPTVAVYLPSGELVIADVTVDGGTVTVTFATPTAGTAVLT